MCVCFVVYLFSSNMVHSYLSIRVYMCIRIGGIGFCVLASACDMQIPFLLHTFQGVVAMGTHCFADFN